MLDMMGFITINIRCNIISGIKNNSRVLDIIYNFNLTQLPGYMIINIQLSVSHQIVTKGRRKYIEYGIRDK